MSSIRLRSHASISSKASSIATGSGSDEIAVDQQSLSYYPYHPDAYDQYLDDFSIIDDLYDALDHESVVGDHYAEQQVVDATRNVVNKHQAIHQLYLHEMQYVKELSVLQQIFMDRWPDFWTQHHKTAKIPCPDMARLFDHLHALIDAHTGLEIWGPTQLVSDLFSNLLDQTTGYAILLENYSDIILNLDKLYHQSTFTKFLQGSTITSLLENRDLLAYVFNPIKHLTIYSPTLLQIIRYTEPCHPDYRALSRVAPYHSAIHQCPVTVTPDRRLLLSAQFIKVDPADLSNTTHTRTFLLYNDALLFTRRHKTKTRQLQYKGTIELTGAQVRPLSPDLIPRMLETRRSSSLPSFFGKKVPVTHQPSFPTNAAYGFEILAVDEMQDLLSALAAPGMHYRSPDAVAIPNKRYIIRTYTLAEQTLWISVLTRVIQGVTQKQYAP
ncbi:Dbl homology domain-containing protein [Radiomyces spectabilis]|uniref:Dbl homology domain-containing protein n=1 Tax=Radiomyces spectabilis TaxID=64574 RepID=UPI0022201977|nr:Dbl homology domain-containing protein [Radiomyces spectabilis]KAI8366019.1 Dbl homology domain-containing protein [Radiomyces spectabilis]